MHSMAPLNSRRAIPSCGRSIAWLWLSLPRLSEKEKVEFLDAPTVSKALFRATVTAMWQQCNLWKRVGKAFEVFLPYYQPSCPVPQQQPGSLAAQTKPGFVEPKQSYVATAAKHCSANPQAETSIQLQEENRDSTQSFSVSSLQNVPLLPPTGKRRRNLNAKIIPADCSVSNICRSVAHVQQVPPKTLSQPLPMGFVLRKENQKFTSIPTQIKSSPLHPGQGLRAQSGMKKENNHKKSYQI